MTKPCQPRRFPSREARRRWIVAADQAGKSGPDIAGELGITRARVNIILRGERQRRQQAMERKRGRLAARGNPASVQVRHLELSGRIKTALLARYGQDVTLVDLAQEPNLILAVNGLGPSGAARLAAVMKARGVQRQ